MDIGHQWGGDLDVSSSGDLASVSGSPALTQRVLRRLLTNAGDYIWSPNYGAGLAAYVGSVSSYGDIMASVRAQMLLEPAVASLPAPTVTVVRTGGSGNGTIELTTTFTEASTGSKSAISLPISG
jgi:hypothetical protein